MTRGEEDVPVLMILMDAAAVMAVVFIVNQGEQLDFGSAAIAGIGISVGCLLLNLLLFDAIGLFAVIPMVGVAIAGIWMGAGIPLGRAAVAGALFMVYKIVVGLAFASVMSGAA
jgi:hypothetical protein